MTPKEQKEIYKTILYGDTPLVERIAFSVKRGLSPYPKEMQESVEKAKEIMRTTKQLSPEEIDEIAEELVVKIE